jgi:uncharacterized membrane protein (DUF4010 family)
MEWHLVRDLAIALALGLLVGLQREWADKKVAGIRTFALIALLGALCGVAARETDNVWIVAAGLAGVAAMLWIGNFVRREDAESGVTTEIAGLVVFMVGVLTMYDMLPLAVVTGGVTAVLLHWKQPLHRLADRIGADDFRAVVRLVIIGMVVLPLLPDEAYGPYGVLNPFRIWLMVVLIVGISLAAYAARRLLGAKVGVILAGVLGGLISSTATTVGYARRSRGQGESAAAAALVVMAASTIVFARVVLEVAVVAPGLLPAVAPPLLVMMAFMMAVYLIAFVRWRDRVEPSGEETPPSDLKAAVLFGLLYAAVLFGVAAAGESFGTGALYGVAALSGMTDMDAITLSTAQVMESGSLETATGWRLIMVGAISNLAFKAGVVAVLGHRELFRRIALLFGTSAAVGVVILLLWPA